MAICIVRLSEILESIRSRIAKEDYACKNIRLGFSDYNKIVIDARDVEEGYRERCYRRALRLLAANLYPYGYIPIVRDRTREWLSIDLKHLAEIVTSSDSVAKSIAKLMITRALYREHILDATDLRIIETIVHGKKMIGLDRVEVEIPNREDLKKKLMTIGIKSLRVEGDKVKVSIDRQVIEYLSEES